MATKNSKSLYIFAHPKFELDPEYDVMVVANSSREAREVFEKETCGPENHNDYKIIAYWRLNRSKVIDSCYIVPKTFEEAMEKYKGKKK